MAAPFDPYHKGLGISASEQPPNCYRLLGLRDFEDDPDVIEAATDQRMTHVRTFQSGPHAVHSKKILNEIVQARRRLLDPEERPTTTPSFVSNWPLGDNPAAAPQPRSSARLHVEPDTAAAKP
jgi:hypothetical protein